MQITINRKTLEIGIAVVVVLLGVLWVFNNSAAPEDSMQPAEGGPEEILNDLDKATTKAQPNVQKTTPPPPPPPPPVASTVFKDYKNASYVIDGNSVSLIGGKSGSGKTEIMSGYEAAGDLNSDSIYDAAFVIKQTLDTGVFYYLSAAIKSNNGYRVTNTIFLGQNISPLNNGISGGEIAINYLDRDSGQPISAAPTSHRSKYFKVVGGVLKAR
jgi:hypothetical protein